MTTARLRAATRAWCTLADLLRVAMIGANRRWIIADDKLLSADPVAWQRDRRAARLRFGHGHYRAMTYRRTP